MDTPRYLDFDLLFEGTGGKYRARVLTSPVGQAAANFALPFSDLELENFMLRMGRTGRGVRRIDSPEMESAKTFGGRLFNAIFVDEVRGCLRSSIDEANRQGLGLRIRVRMSDAPELASLPWEYLYNPALNRFVVLSNETPLVRYLELPERIQPLDVKPPLRILVMISSPSDYAPLDVAREWDKLNQALQDLQNRGLVVLEQLEVASLAALQRRLRQRQYHIFHFVGHGGFKEQAEDGVLVMEDDAKRGHLVSGQDLGTLLHDHRSLRLAVLNACEGARTSRTDPFAGTAQNLVQQGIPAVIAMQFEISDDAAIILSREFYGAVADGYPVDAALAEARKAIFASGNDVEWGTPVLYMRAPDGRIFDVAPLAEGASRPVQAQPEPVIPVVAAEKPAPARPTRTEPVVPAQTPVPERTVSPKPAKSKSPNWLGIGLLGAVALVAVCMLGALGIALQFIGSSGGDSTPIARQVANATSAPSLPLANEPTRVPPAVLPVQTNTLVPPAFVPAPTSTPAPALAPATVFEDGFDGPGLNSQNWVAANPVGLAVSNGSLWMSSTSNRYAYVYSRGILFPPSGNFRLTIGFQYVTVGTCGAGFMMTSYDPATLAGLGQDEAGKREQAGEQNGVAAGIWEDSASGLQLWYRAGGERQDVQLAGQDTGSHVLTIEYQDGQYAASLDGAAPLYASQPTLHRPHYLWIGHPATLGGNCNWSSLGVDDIKIETLP